MQFATTGAATRVITGHDVSLAEYAGTCEVLVVDAEIQHLTAGEASGIVGGYTAQAVKLEIPYLSCCLRWVSCCSSRAATGSLTAPPVLSAAPGMSMIFRGDDVFPGKVILQRGRVLSSADIGALAAKGTRAGTAGFDNLPGPPADINRMIPPPCSYYHILSWPQGQFRVISYHFVQFGADSIVFLRQICYHIFK